MVFPRGGSNLEITMTVPKHGEMKTILPFKRFLARLYKSTGRAIALTSASASATVLLKVNVFISLYLLNVKIYQVDTLHVLSFMLYNHDPAE